MTPEIIGRVDAWLARAGAPQSLEKVWRHLRAIRYSSSHVDAEDAIGAAMRGVLLELVRWAWDWNVWAESSFDSDIWLVMCPELGPEMDGRPLIGSVDIEGRTEDEALACALEAAPRREPSV